jgi:hypothetical protein
VIKKIAASAAVAASIVGAGAAIATPAMAIGNDTGTTSASGNGALTAYGNQKTQGAFSPQQSLVNGSLNKPCVALSKINAGSLVGLVPITVQDVNVLANPQQQQCSDNSTQAKRDEPLSHILSNIPVLSGNGAANG